ncbi:MAG: putative metabolite transport protein ywtG [Chlamydiota bacterium]
MIQEKLTPYLIFSVLIATLSGFLFGYHTAVISGALLFLSSAFHLSIANQGVIVSIVLVGCIFGSLIGGTMTERWGRKQTLLIASILFIVGAVLLSLSESYTCLIWGRLISGVAVGLVSIAAPLYISEISPPRHRGMFVSSYQLAITMGILGSFIVNYFYTQEGNWRCMFFIGAIPAALQFVGLTFLRETPPWLFKKGEDEKALNLLQKLRYGKQWVSQAEAMKSAAHSHKKMTWAALYSSKLRFVLIIGLVLSCFQQITGINTVIYYAPKIFEIAGFTSVAGAMIATVGVGVINTLATLVSVWLLDRIGRRKLLLIGTVGMGIALLIIAMGFFSNSSWLDELSVLSLMAYVSFFAIGLGPVTWVLLAEIYPLKIRSRAMALAALVNWSFNYLVSLTFLDLIQGIGPGLTFLLYALISMLSFGFVFLFIPETKGKTLEEIESMIYR